MTPEQFLRDPNVQAILESLRNTGWTQEQIDDYMAQWFFQEAEARNEFIDVSTLSPAWQKAWAQWQATGGQPGGGDQGGVGGTTPPAGTTPPSGAVPPDSTMPPAGVAPDASSIYGPFAAYLAKMGLAGRTSFNPAEEYIASLSDPLESLYQFQTKRAGAGPETGVGVPGAWEDWIGAAPWTARQISDKARAFMSGLFAPETRGTGFDYNPSYNAATGGMSSGNLGELQDLLRLGLRGRGAPQAVNWIAQRLPQEQLAWQSGQAAGQPYGSFLDYFKKRYAQLF